MNKISKSFTQFDSNNTQPSTNSQGLSWRKNKSMFREGFSDASGFEQNDTLEQILTIFNITTTDLDKAAYNQKYNLGVGDWTLAYRQAWSDISTPPEPDIEDYKIAAKARTTDTNKITEISNAISIADIRAIAERVTDLPVPQEQKSKFDKVEQADPSLYLNNSLEQIVGIFNEKKKEYDTKYALHKTNLETIQKNPLNMYNTGLYKNGSANEYIYVNNSGVAFKANATIPEKLHSSCSKAATEVSDASFALMSANIDLTTHKLCDATGASCKPCWSSKKVRKGK